MPKHLKGEDEKYAKPTVRQKLNKTTIPKYLEDE